MTEEEKKVIDFPQETDELNAPYMIISIGGRFAPIPDNSYPVVLSVKVLNGGPEAEYYLLNEEMREEGGNKYSCQCLLRKDIDK